jgi:hypothetical protein
MPATKQQKKLSPEQTDRLWQRYLSEESIFNDRLNFFLVLESILLGAVITLFGQNNFTQREFILRLSALLGFVLTIIWIYVSARQKWVLGIVRRIAFEKLDEFRLSELEIAKGRWPIRIRTLLAHVIPLSFLLVWIIIQFII